MQGLGNSLYLFVASCLRGNFLLDLIALEGFENLVTKGCTGGCRCPRGGSWGLSLIESGDCTLFIVQGGPYLIEDRMTP